MNKQVDMSMLVEKLKAELGNLIFQLAVKQTEIEQLEKALAEKNAQSSTG